MRPLPRGAMRSRAAQRGVNHGPITPIRSLMTFVVMVIWMGSVCVTAAPPGNPTAMGKHGVAAGIQSAVGLNANPPGGKAPRHCRAEPKHSDLATPRPVLPPAPPRPRWAPGPRNCTFWGRCYGRAAVEVAGQTRTEAEGWDVDRRRRSITLELVRLRAQTAIVTLPPPSLCSPSFALICSSARSARRRCSDNRRAWPGREHDRRIRCWRRADGAGNLAQPDL